MHGEQGALIATAKIVGHRARHERQVLCRDAGDGRKKKKKKKKKKKARHVEAYKRLLHEKLEVAYPINKALQTLLEQTLTDRRWDMTYLGMQVLIEGWRSPPSSRSATRRATRCPAAVNAYVMQDEAPARLVRPPGAARILSASRVRPSATSARSSRSRRCYFMRDRFNQSEVWERLGLPAKVLDDIHYNSKQMNSFRGRLFSRVVPTVKDIGLWGPAGAEGLRRDGRDGIRQDRCRQKFSPTTARWPTTSTGRCSSRRRSRAE